ncbi:MAG: hypothetical protein LBO62_06780 [Endomicrobium sp.]|jgi:hypothetical protein|nr:hypothetical protein [Endomicrobium sp.]
MRNNIVISSIFFAVLVLIFPGERGLLDRGRFEEGFIYNIERSTSGISSPRAQASRGIGLSGQYAQEDDDFINASGGSYGGDGGSLGGGYGGSGVGGGFGEGVRGTSGSVRYGYGSGYQNERNKIFIAYTELELPEMFRVQRFGVKERSEIVITSTASFTVDEKKMEEIKARALEEAKISVAAEIKEEAARAAAEAEAKSKSAEAIRAAKLKAQKEEEARQRANKAKNSANAKGTAGENSKNAKSGGAGADYNFYNKIIKDSRKTFFFPDNFKTVSDVAVGVYTATPYEDKHIIKFQIKNNSTSYFFIANISLYKEGDFVICDYYNDSMISGGRVLEGIIVSPIFKSKEKITLKLIESSGKNRSYEISFTIP